MVINQKIRIPIKVTIMESTKVLFVAQFATGYKLTQLATTEARRFPERFELSDGRCAAEAARL